MTVLELVNISTNEKFYCQSDNCICITYQPFHKYKGQWIPNKHTRTTTHQPCNQCIKSVWKDYASFNRFSNREVVKVDGNTIYCHWSKEDLIKEFSELFDHVEIISIDWITNTITDL